MVLVHRCRFVQYAPQSIHCIAFEKPAQPNHVRVAVSRGNADIEIWNVTNDFHLERVIPGGEELSVEALVWVDGRLFSAGIHSQITEWDIDSLQPLTVADSLGGPIWSLAANHAGTFLAAGCEDGCIKIFEIAGGILQYVRSFDKEEGRVLSLDWNLDDSVLVSGGSDSAIRLWSTETGRCKLRILVQDEKKDATLVWSVRHIDETTIASGDSRGRVQFWNAKYGTLRQTFTQHEADVLSLVVDLKDKSVYASGVDNRVIQLTLANTGRKAEWILAGRCRDHTHDVRALALGPLGELVTGGVDCNLIVYSTSNFGALGASHRKIPPFPHRKLIYVANAKNLIMYKHPRKLQLWHLGSPVSAEPIDASSYSTISRSASNESSAVPIVSHQGLPNGHKLKLDMSPSLLLELCPKSSFNILCCAISPDGTRIAFSDAFSIRVFNLAYVDGKVSKVTPLKMASDIDAAHEMVFISEGGRSTCRRLLTASCQGQLQVIDLDTVEGATELVVSLDVPVSQNATISSRRSTSCLLASSTDGQLGAVSFDGMVHIFNLDGLQYHGSLPVLSSQPTAIAFMPNSLVLVVTCVNNMIFFVNAETNKLTDWSRKHSTCLPLQWLRRKEKIVGITFNPSNPSCVVFHDHACFVVLYLDRPMPDVNVPLFDPRSLHERKLAQIEIQRADEFKDKGVLRGKKRKEPPKDSSEPLRNSSDPTEDSVDHIDVPKHRFVGQSTRMNFCGVKKYQPLLCLEFIGPESLVAIERPWLSIMEDFPPPLYRSHYGS